MRSDFIRRLARSPLSPAETDALALRAQVGDSRAADELVRRCVALVAKAARVEVARNPHLQEDIEADAFGASMTVALAKWRKGSGASFTTFLFRMLRWQAERVTRAHQEVPTSGPRVYPAPRLSFQDPVNERGRELSEELGDAAHAPDVLLTREMSAKAEVEALLEGLQPHPRLLKVVRGRLAERTHADIAKELGTSRETCRLLEIRALEVLRGGDSVELAGKYEQRRHWLAQHPDSTTARCAGVWGVTERTAERWLAQHAQRVEGGWRCHRETA